jgi:hypothetical protein
MSGHDRVSHKKHKGKAVPALIILCLHCTADTMFIVTDVDRPTKEAEKRGWEQRPEGWVCPRCAGLVEQQHTLLPLVVS